MHFNFVSQKIGLFESFWKFKIPEHEVETLFLIVTDVREPSVYFLSSHVVLKSTFIGSTSDDFLTLVNNENSSFDFHFLNDSVYSEGRTNYLTVEPMSGKISQHSELNIKYMNE